MDFIQHHHSIIARIGLHLTNSFLCTLPSLSHLSAQLSVMHILAHFLAHPTLAQHKDLLMVPLVQALEGLLMGLVVEEHGERREVDVFFVLVCLFVLTDSLGENAHCFRSDDPIYIHHSSNSDLYTSYIVPNPWASVTNILYLYLLTLESSSFPLRANDESIIIHKRVCSICRIDDKCAFHRKVFNIKSSVSRSTSERVRSFSFVKDKL